MEVSFRYVCDPINKVTELFAQAGVLATLTDTT